MQFFLRWFLTAILPVFCVDDSISYRSTMAFESKLVSGLPEGVLASIMGSGQVLMATSVLSAQGTVFPGELAGHEVYKLTTS